MKEVSSGTSIGMPRVSPPVWHRGDGSLGFRLRSLDSLSVALILLLAAAWLSQGAAALTGVSPHSGERVVEVIEAGIGVWLALRVVRERRFRLLVPLAMYIAWVVTGLINSDAPYVWQTTSLRNWLIGPVLAVLLALEGTGERRTRAMVVALLALTAFEFVLTLVQLLVVPRAQHDSDLIVGSFGTHQNAVIGVVILLLACVASAGYLIDAKGGKRALAASVILALASGWVVIKFATILLPVVVAITAVSALLLKRTDRRRGLLAIAAALLSSLAVVGSYSIFKPGSFSALNPAGGLSSYLANGSIGGNVREAQLGDTVVGDYWNAAVVVRALPVAAGVPRTRGFGIFDVGGGAYTADVARRRDRLWSVHPGRPYLFTLGLVSRVHTAQTVVLEIEWLDSRLRRLSDSIGRPSGVTDRRGLVVDAPGFAPPGASFAIGKVAVFGDEPKGTSIYAWSPQVRPTAPQVVAGPPEASIAGTTLRNYWNAGIETELVPGPANGASPERGFRVANLSSGDYTATLSEQHHRSLAVLPGRLYSFSVTVGDTTAEPLAVKPEIEWRAKLPTDSEPFRGILSTTVGSSRIMRPVAGGATRLLLSGVAPAHARFAFPKLAFTGDPPAGSASLAYQPTFREVGRRAVGPSQGRPSRAGPGGSAPPAGRPARPSHAAAPSPASHPAAGSAPPHRRPRSAGQSGGRLVVVGVLPGHLDLLKDAIRGLSGSITHEIFGFGLGSTRVGHIVDAAHLTPREAGGESDLGTLLIERGWSGVAIVAVLAILLVFLALRLTTQSADVGGWVTAFRLAVPGAIVALAAYALLGDMLQTTSSAITFWIVIGLGLATRVKPDSRTAGP